MRVLRQLQRSGSRILSNFHATTKDGEAPYDELGPADLARMTLHTPSFYENLGKASLALSMLDSPKMESLIRNLPEGVLTQARQRALRKSAVQVIADKYETYKKNSIFRVLHKQMFPGLFQEIRRVHQLGI